MTNKVAILIDGGYVRAEYAKSKKKHIGSEEVLSYAKNICKKVCPKDSLFRIYFYDAKPFEGKKTLPISKALLDFKKHPAYQHIVRFQNTLARSDYVAFRFGMLSFRGWRLKNDKVIHEMINKPRSPEDDDFKPMLEQKMVDIKIGLDIAWLASKRIVDKIVIVTADMDFIPAMKFARKEGLHVVLCTLNDSIRPEMREHADETKVVTF